MSESGAVAASLAGPLGVNADDPIEPSLHGAQAWPRSIRRSFTKEYKLLILTRAHELRSLGRGRIQAMLRQEGLRTSHLAEWKKQLSEECLGSGRRGRPERSRDALYAEIRRLKHRLAALEKRCLDAEALVVMQMKYVKAASLKLEGKDRGLLSSLIAQVEADSSIAAACLALGLNRPDFYRTIRPLKQDASGRQGQSP